MDRRVIWALVLMMVIAIGPSFFLKPTPHARPQPAATRDTTAPAATPATPVLPESVKQGAVAALPADTVLVSSPLYQYAFSTRGGGLIQATLQRYRALNPADRGTPVRLIRDSAAIHQLALLVGHDTLSLNDWTFVPSTRRLDVSAPASLSLTGTRGGVVVRLEYRFRPDDYQIEVEGRIDGLGPVGGHLLIGMGDGLRQTESDSAGNNVSGWLTFDVRVN